MGKEIVIDIEPNGDTKMEGFGFVGAECEKAMKPLEEAIGATVKTVEKPEIHRTRAATRTNAR